MHHILVKVFQILRESSLLHKIVLFISKQLAAVKIQLIVSLHESLDLGSDKGFKIGLQGTGTCWCQPPCLRLVTTLLLLTLGCHAGHMHAQSLIRRCQSSTRSSCMLRTSELAGSHSRPQASRVGKTFSPPRSFLGLLGLDAGSPCALSSRLPPSSNS